MLSPCPLVECRLTMALRKILRADAARDATGLSRPAMYRAIADGTFPQSVMIGPRTPAFYEDEIAEWLASRPRGPDSVHGRRLRRARDQRAHLAPAAPVDHEVETITGAPSARRRTPDRKRGAA
jgi:prophage regulatory protein